MAAPAAAQSLWRHGAFMRVWAGSTISQVGDQITSLALPWLVLQLTHSPARLGIVVGLQNLPFLLFTLIASVYAADRDVRCRSRRDVRGDRALLRDSQGLIRRRVPTMGRRSSEPMA